MWRYVTTRVWGSKSFGLQEFWVTRVWVMSGRTRKVVSYSDNQESRFKTVGLSECVHGGKCTLRRCTPFWWHTAGERTNIWTEFSGLSVAGRGLYGKTWLVIEGWSKFDQPWKKRGRMWMISFTFFLRLSFLLIQKQNPSDCVWVVRRYRPSVGYRIEDSEFRSTGLR